MSECMSPGTSGENAACVDRTSQHGSPEAGAGFLCSRSSKEVGESRAQCVCGRVGAKDREGAEGGDARW